jgi:uncharacterized membrane protein
LSRHGTWGGWWQVPAQYAPELGLSYAEYNTYWTGVTEVLGGIMLLTVGLGLFSSINFPPRVLTLAVTTASTYMFTNDAKMTNDAHVPYPRGRTVSFEAS